MRCAQPGRLVEELTGGRYGREPRWLRIGPEVVGLETGREHPCLVSRQFAQALLPPQRRRPILRRPAQLEGAADTRSMTGKYGQLSDRKRSGSA
jgi:hypothetical protein